jgi:hypothetical protein
LERALDHLRTHLSERGVALGALALIGLLETQSQTQISPILVTTINSGVLTQTGVVVVKSGLSFSKLVLLTGTALLILGLYPIFHRPVQPAPTAAPVEAAQPRQTREPMFSAPSPTPVDSVAPTPIPQPAQGHDFRLFLVDAQTQQPVSGAKVIFWAQPDDRSENRLDIQWTTNGYAFTHWTNDCEGFIADVQCENYAMTRIQWKRELNILPVPDAWTLQLEPATPIGGIVVDTDGQPIASANIKAWSSGDFFICLPGTHQPTVSHPLGWMSDLTTSTDSNGRWQINTLARSVLDAQLIVLIDHPDYTGDRSDLHTGQPKEDLRRLEFRSVLQRNDRRQITGVVLDASGTPLPNAEVTDGTLFNNPGQCIVGDHHVVTDTNGTFLLVTKPDVKGKAILTAKAPGFAPKTETWSGSPITIQLQAGHPLKLHVVGPTGDPVAGIRAETTHYQDRSTHCEFHSVSDAQGEVLWNDLPNEPLLITFFSDLEDFQSLVGQVVEPSEQERSFNLLSSLNEVATRFGVPPLLSRSRRG